MSLLPVKNSYCENQYVIISIASVCQHKKDIMVLYPYGGTDFGSFMLFVVQVGYNLHNSIVIFHNSVQFSGFVISRVWQKNNYSLQTYILLCQKTIYLSSTFTDSIFILSKLRQNIVDFQGIITDYHYKMLFLQQEMSIKQHFIVMYNHQCPVKLGIS